MNDETHDAHRKMVERAVARWSFQNPAVVEALTAIPRDRFVPPDLHSQAFNGGCIVMPGGYSISDAGLVAYMVEALQLKPTDRVLDVGSGSGYHAAMLAQIAKEVYGVERLPVALARAKETLDGLGFKNISLQLGDGFEGLPQFAPYDAINIACAVVEIPRPLIRQLRPGGRMIMPFSPSGLPPEEGPQHLLLIEKRGDAAVGDTDLDCCIQQQLCDVRFMMMRRE